MNKEVKIYVLKNPETNEIHYVGRSVNPNGRYRVHIYLARHSKHKNKKDAWICSLLNKGLKPDMEIIDSVSIENAMEKEKYWIEKYWNICDLKNSRDYIENNYIFSKESRKKMSEAAKRTCNKRGTKVSEDGRKNISLSKKGIKQTKEHIEKKSKKILQYDKEGNFIKEWPSGVDAAKELGLNQGLISSSALNIGYRKSHGGFIWKYKN